MAREWTDLNDAGSLGSGYERDDIDRLFHPDREPPLPPFCALDASPFGGAAKGGSHSPTMAPGAGSSYAAAEVAPIHPAPEGLAIPHNVGTDMAGPSDAAACAVTVTLHGAFVPTWAAPAATAFIERDVGQDLAAADELNALGGGAGAHGVLSGFGLGAMGSGAIVFGVTTDQSDQAMYADVARSTFGVTGGGIKIGILSDSFNLLGGAATDQADGDLPAGGVTVLEEGPAGSTDEGRAMAELIHKVAPGAQLYFHTASINESDYAAGIQALKAQGCQIIVDDVAYPDEPFYQDGSAIQQAVHTVVAGGASYFAAAGNADHNFYESAFHPITASLPGVGTVTAQNFGGGNVFQNITIPVGEQGEVILQWDQPFATIGSGHSSQSSLNIYVYDSSGTQLQFDANNNDVGGNPVQWFSFLNNSTETSFKVAITDSSGRLPGLFKYEIIPEAPDSVAINDPNAGIGSGSIFGHELNTDANTVGATYWGATPRFGVNPPQIEPFSSVGPGELLFDSSGNRLSVPDVLGKIDFAAPDGSSTSVFNPFFGTSAAAPEAAAVAALMLQVNPALNPQDITNLLRDSSIDMGPPGFDSATGAGFIQADRAVASAGGTITITFDQPTYVGTHLGDIFLVGPIAGSIDHSITGVGGVNTLDLSAAPTGVTINLALGTDQNGFGGTDHFAGIQDFKGSAFNDAFIGGPGSHTLDGGGGVDTLDYSGASGPVTVNFITGTAQNGFGGTDTISNFHAAIGGNGNDTFVAGPGVETFDGGGGTNTVVLSGTFSQYSGTSFGFATFVLGSGTPETFDGLLNVQDVQFAGSHTDPVPANVPVVHAMQHGGSFLAGEAQYADLNGDGKADLIYQGLDNRFWLSLSTGGGFSAAQEVVQHGGSFLAGEAQYADVNGDGKADLIYQGLDNRFWLSLSTGTGLGLPQQVLQHGGGFMAGEAQYADVDGDGKADLIYQGLDNRFWLSSSTGTGLSAPQLVLQHGGGFVAGEAQYADINGDGKADLIYQGLDNRFWLSLSTGTGFSAPQLVAQQGGGFVAGQAQYADINGDGKADLIYQGLDNRFWVSLSTGTGLSAPQLALELPGSFVPGQVHYADVDGDGKAELIFQTGTNQFLESHWTGSAFTTPEVVMQHGGTFAAGEAQFADVGGVHAASLVYQGQDNQFWLTSAHPFAWT